MVLPFILGVVGHQFAYRTGQAAVFRQVGQDGRDEGLADYREGERRSAPKVGSISARTWASLSTNHGWDGNRMGRPSRGHLSHHVVGNWACQASSVVILNASRRISSGRSRPDRPRLMSSVTGTTAVASSTVVKLRYWNRRDTSRRADRLGAAFGDERMVHYRHEFGWEYNHPVWT